MDLAAPATDHATPHAGPPASPAGPPRPRTTASVSPLRVVHDTDGVDLAEAERAADRFLRALGVDLDGESLGDTPGRMARAYAELFSPRPFDLTTFPNDEGYDELVLARGIPVRSVCEHHMLPVVGTAHVGYLPGDRILGLSKLARVVEHFACRPQVQERLTKQVADWLDTHLAPKGVGVVIEAEHSCMTLRGVRATGSTTLTSTLLGSFRHDARSRAEFLSLTGLSS
ncbi:MULTISPECIES: GTP cyclohydrolase I FolE [Streptomyces]|uniref:GTP cyclohydrolase I FolE n=1 Tax=Streptomyces TaxID=1883 RepID=UPI0002EEEBE5|nr:MULTISPECIES: GTP cyclohydrolase I FolE [unclassified Streptomyces]MBU8553663.1 GTP cyclohydrolase I FolE [Streptomyces sp. Osf17]MBU8560456.1 GTP cyclohydrolase I FolE [Streptomyces sp. Babs14]MDV6287266.1 GTP cyclohydrolase I FolE [Streptomyces sp. UP1A-1]